MVCLCVNIHYFLFSHCIAVCLFLSRSNYRRIYVRGLLKVECYDNCSLGLLNKQETPEHSGVNRCLLVVSLARMLMSREERQCRT